MDSWVSLAAIFLVILFIITPIVVRVRMRVSADPRLETVEADDARLPEAAKAFFCDVAAELAPLGFQPAAYLINPGPMSNVTSYLAIFEHRAARDGAAAMAAFARPTRARTVPEYVVEFMSEYTDGLELNTTNAANWQWRAAAPQKEIWRLPMMRDLAQLYRVHQALTARHTRATKRPLPDPDQQAAELRAAIIKDCQEQSAAGFMYLGTRGEQFRMTCKGSMLAVWGLLWPIGAIRRWNATRRARRLLQELGLPANYDTVDYKERFARHGAIPQEELAPPAKASPSMPPPPPPKLVGRCPVCRGSIVIERPLDPNVCCPRCRSIVPTPSHPIVMRTSQSGLGIASFVLAIVAGLTNGAALAYAATGLPDTSPEIEEDSLALAVFSLMFLCANSLALVGLGLGVAGFVQKTKKRVFAVLGVCLNVLILLGIVALMLIGTMA